MRDEIAYRSGEVCVRCSILFSERNDKWSSDCNVGEINPDPKATWLLKAKGHLWNRNPIYKKDLSPVK